MKDILMVVKENFILLFGTGLFIRSLFSFDYRHNEYMSTSYYFYTDTNLFLLTIGIISIVIGLLKIWKK